MQEEIRSNCRMVQTNDIRRALHLSWRAVLCSVCLCEAKEIVIKLPVLHPGIEIALIV